MNKVLRLSAMAVLALMTFSCADKKPEAEEPLSYDESMSEPQIGEESQQEAVADGNLSLECNDQMQFTKNELKAPAGAITLTLKHIGKMDKAVMGHNLVILKPGTDVADFCLKAADAKATAYIADSEKSKVIAHTKLLGGGESDTIEFTITEKGTYDYICSFPGHSAVMKGKLIVE